MDAILGIFLKETGATSHFVSHFVKMGGGSRLLEIPPPILATSHFKMGAPYSRRCFARRGNFLKKCKGITTYYALFGQMASRRVRRI